MKKSSPSAATTAEELQMHLVVNTLPEAEAGGVEGPKALAGGTVKTPPATMSASGEEILMVQQDPLAGFLSARLLGTSSLLKAAGYVCCLKVMA